jgi:rhamnosyltransferase
MASEVCAVLVAYQPKFELLRQVVEAVGSQVGRVVVVDNGNRGQVFDQFSAAVSACGHVLYRSPVNVGLAAGLNRGIEHARTAGFRYVLLLDQDSVVAPDMVGALLREYSRLSATMRVGAVGAQYVDPRDGALAPFVRLGFPFNRKLGGGPGECVESDFLISSGSLLSMAAIDDVGDMDESLFIDNVDLDWSFRARSRGYALYGICDARMQHSIGDTLRPSRWRRRGIFIHSPTRLYYLTRNRLLLYRRAHTPRVWIAQDILRFVGKFVRMSLFIAPRADNARAMLRGILDGVRGRAGALE